MNEFNNVYSAQDTYLKSNNQSEASYDLQDIIHQFQSQPELLKLILTSKVEEDKRKAEEAKLRTKELDVYFKNNQTPLSPEDSPRRLTFVEKYEDSDESMISSNNNKDSRKMSVISTNSCLSSYRMLPYPKMRDEVPGLQKHHSISSLSSEDSLNDSHQQQRRHSAAAAMLAMGSGSPPAADRDIKMDEYANRERSNTIPFVLSSAYPSPVADHDEFKEKCDQDSLQKPRRRREMQPITKIVETREHPYVDNYFWKNNGNTIQKKTGCKSVYYKCSNSNKGCSVNKTVTERPKGEYIIKYRGEHLPECGRVERIREI